jgi:8-oxo-dGTP pyrophosphatase MutT (NUDIX family)
LREEGRDLYTRIMNAGYAKIPVRVLKSKNISRFIKMEEVSYSVGHIHATWHRITSGTGVTILPVLHSAKGDRIVMIYKPQPAIGQWSFELPSGGIEDGSESETVLKELLEETGFKSKRIKKLMELAHAPFRLGWVDEVYVAEKLNFVGRATKENEEFPIRTVILTIPEVKHLLQANKIINAMSVAVLTTFLYGKELEQVKDLQKKKKADFL